MGHSWEELKVRDWTLGTRESIFKMASSFTCLVPWCIVIIKAQAQLRRSLGWPLFKLTCAQCSSKQGRCSPTLCDLSLKIHDVPFVLIVLEIISRLPQFKRRGYRLCFMIGQKNYSHVLKATQTNNTSGFMRHKIWLWWLLHPCIQSICWKLMFHWNSEDFSINKCDSLYKR